MDKSPEVPFMSVITVCFNALETLRQTAESVAQQSDRDWEHIIVDGGSTDGTVDFLKSLSNSNIRWISEPDSGIYNAMNKGLKMTRGQVVSFLNADDVYFSDTLEKVKAAFDPQTDIVYGDLRKERLLNGKWHHRMEQPNLDLMPQTMGIFHPATFIRSHLFDQLGPYDEQYRLSADYEWLLRAYLAKARFKYVDQPLAIFRVGGVSTLNCASYEEGLAILQQHKTGYADDMKKLVSQCRKKVFARRLIYILARITGTKWILEKRMAKNWTENNGDFAA